MPGVEKLTHITSPDSPSVLELEGAAPPQDLSLKPRRQPPPSPGFSPKDLDDLTMPPSEHAYLAAAMTLLDPAMLESLEMTISHTLATGEVHYHLQVQSLMQMSLLSTSSWGQLGPYPKVEEPWAIIMLCNITETPVPRIDLNKYPLSQWSEF